MNVQYGEPRDLPAWMALVREVKGNFPGLETEAALTEHEKTVSKFMSERRALCVKDGDNLVGVLLFSRRRNMICCLAVRPEYRRRGVATRLMDKALSELDPRRNVTLTTFRAEDERGIAPRALYEKYGFTAGELTEEFGYPCQAFTLHRA